MNNNKKTKRFFVLKNFKSHFIKPVALEVDTSENGEKSDIVREAEAIIDNYLKKMGYNGVCLKKSQRRGAIAVSLLLVFGIAAVFFLIMRFV